MKEGNTNQKYQPIMSDNKRAKPQAFKNVLERRKKESEKKEIKVEANQILNNKIEDEN